MTASTLVRPLPESAEPDHNTTHPRPAHTPAPATSQRAKKAAATSAFLCWSYWLGWSFLAFSVLSATASTPTSSATPRHRTGPEHPNSGR